MRQLIRTPGIFVATVGLLLLAWDARAQDTATGNPRLAEVESAVGNYIDAGEVAGAVTLVAQDGKVVHLGAQGLADVQTERSITPKTMFAVASMTKPITATALMILVEEGKVKLDDPISKYIPEFADVKLKDQPLAEPITVRQCLTHTAGLGGSQRNVESLENTARQIAARPLQYQPGSKWQYSPGISVTGRVVEVAAGQKFEQFLQERLFDPLKMHDTTFFPSPEQRERIATLYATQEEGLKPATSWIGDFDTDRSPNPSAGLYSTAGDLFRFYQMVLNGGFLEDAQILKRESVTEMTRLQTGELTTGFTPGNGWGLGWCVVLEPQGVSAALSSGSFGHGGAFGTQGWVDPQKKRIFVLLVQRSNFPNSDASDLRRDFQNAAAAALGD